MILASCGYDDAMKYNGKLVLRDDSGDSKKKKEEVQLNINTDDAEYIFTHGIGVANCITTVTSPKYCPDSLKGRVFRFYDYADISKGVSEVDGVIPLIRLPEGYSDMRELAEIMDKYPTARVTGGNLLEIPGFRIGRYEKGKEKMSSVFNGIYDVFKELPLSELSVQEVMGKVRSKGTIKSARVKKDVIRKVTTKDLKKKAFNELFGEEDDVF